MHRPRRAIILLPAITFTTVTPFFPGQKFFSSEPSGLNASARRQDLSRPRSRNEKPTHGRTIISAGSFHWARHRLSPISFYGISTRNTFRPGYLSGPRNRREEYATRTRDGWRNYYFLPRNGAVHLPSALRTCTDNHSNMYLRITILRITRR